MLHKSFKPAKCKTSLKLATSRIKLLKNKKEVQLKQLKREVAQLLESGKDQTARIRVEHVIREEKAVSAYDLIEIYCELIAARLAIIESQKNCPIDLKEAITSVIFASPRCADIPELLDICKHFTAKYGKEFKSAAVELRPDCGVNLMLVEKLSAVAPDGQTKIKILSAIAEEHNIKWDPKSFGDKESKPSDDLLNGAKSFETASGMHAGYSNVQNLPNDDQNHHQPVNNSVQNKRSSSGSHNFAAADIGSTKITATTSHPEVRPSETQVENMEVAQSFSRDKNALSLGGQKWNMEFMDATSAARAAAESAELASMAARAAAELASRGKVTRHSTKSRKTNDHGIKNEGPGEYDASRLPPEHLVNNPVNNSLYGASPNLQNEQIFRNEHANPARVSDAFYQDAHGNANRSSNEASLRSGKASIDDDKLVNSLEEVGGYSKKGPSEDETIKSNEHMFFAKMNMSKTSVDDEAPVESLKKVDRFSQSRLPEGEVVNAKESALSQEINMKKQFSESDVELVSGQQEKKSESIDYFGTERIERNFNGASSRSQSSTVSGDYNILNSNNQKFGKHADTFMAANEVNIHGDSRPILSNENAAVVFDESGSDEDEYGFGVGSKYDMQESKLYFPSPGGQSPTHISANADSWRFGQDMMGTMENSSSQSYVSTEQGPSPDPLRSSKKSSDLPKPDNLPHVTFDDSDNPNPETGNEPKKSMHGGTADSGIHLEKQNIYPRNQVLAQSIGSSFADEGKSISEGTQWLDSDDDSDSMKVQPRKNRGTELNANSQRKLSYSGLPASRRSPDRTSQLDVNNAGSELPLRNPVDDGNFEDNDHTPQLSLKDDEFLSQPSSGSGKELNFGALTGGFRNKGFRLPRYTKIPSSDSSSLSKNAAEDRPNTIEHSVASSTVDISINSAINRKVNNKSSSRAPITHFDSDSDNSEEETHQKTPNSEQEPYKQKEEKDVNSKLGLRAAVTYFDSDDGSSEEDLPKQTFTSRVRLGSGFSRRTKPSTAASSSQSKVRVGSEASGNSDSTMERNPSRNSYDVDTLPKPQTQAVSSGPSLGLEQSSSTKLAASKPMPESKISSHKESLKPSSMEQSSSPLQKTVASGSTQSAKTSTSRGETPSKEDAIERPSHIHPKLPDYDSIATQLQSLRFNRQ